MGGEQILRRCYNLYSCSCLAGSAVDLLCSCAGFAKQEIPRTWSPAHSLGDWDCGFVPLWSWKLCVFGHLWVMCSVTELSSELDPTVPPLPGSSAGLWAFSPPGFSVWEDALHLFFHSAPSELPLAPPKSHRFLQSVSP